MTKLIKAEYMLGLDKKPRSTIQQLVTALENPTSNEHIEKLNMAIGKYLDTQGVVQNLSFWETVDFRYWSLINLTKLSDKEYDASNVKFIKKIREIAKERTQNSPVLTPVSSVENLNGLDPVNDELGKIDMFRKQITKISNPVKYTAAGVGIALVALFTFHVVRD